jgi:hypothetical protein
MAPNPSSEKTLAPNDDQQDAKSDHLRQESRPSELEANGGAASQDVDGEAHGEAGGTLGTEQPADRSDELPSSAGRLPGVLASGVGYVHQYTWGNYVDSKMPSLSEAQGLFALRSVSWQSRKSMWDIDDLEVVCSMSVEDSQGGEVLVRTAYGLAQAFRRGTSLTFRIASASQEDAAKVEEMLRERLPERKQATGWDGKIGVSLWSIGEGGPGHFSRTLEAPLLEEIAHNYSHRTLTRLKYLRGFEPPPENGRLILLHGDPGTGKSHSVMALGAEWREWADVHLITDPENVFRDPNYLMTVMGGGGSYGDLMDYTEPGDELAIKRLKRSERRWKIIVLEDAGEFMSVQARAQTGQALSRLLNMTDGIIGSASRAMLVITTNERLGDLHPAVSRPGRCHMEIDFLPLGPDEIATWCERNDVDELPRAQRMTVAELYAWKRGERPAAENQTGFGFAA